MQQRWKVVGLALVGLIANVSAVLAQDCRGRDMLADMKATQPDRYQAIVAEAARTANGDAVFWLVEKAGVAPSWLLGTVHMSDGRVSVPTAAVSKALDEAKTVAVEVADMGSEAMMALMTKSPDLFVYRDGHSLADILNRDDLQVVVEHLKASGYPEQLAPMVRPWLAVTMLEMSDCERQRGRDGQLVLDQRINEDGKRRGLPVVGLETAGSQLAAMAAIPEAQQTAMLKATIKYIDRSNDLSETLIQIYLKRQVGAAWPFQLMLAEDAGVGPDAFADFRDTLIVARNKVMADKAKPLLEQGGALIAVGSLHLVGNDGLVALLRQAGYTVSPIE